MQVEVREASLVENLSRLRHRVPLVRRGGILGREGVDEPVRELLERQGDHAVTLGRMGEGRRARLQGRERQLQDALRRRRAHRHTGAAVAAVEQQLDEQTAVGVADQHRRLVELCDQRGVVVDDLGDPQPGGVVRRFSHLLDVSDLARPLGRRDGEAPRAEVVDVVLPAARRQPGAVDEHQRDLSVCGHGALLRSTRATLTPAEGEAPVRPGEAAVDPEKQPQAERATSTLGRPSAGELTRVGHPGSRVLPAPLAGRRLLG